jgi:hypothetical protein
MIRHRVVTAIDLFLAPANIHTSSYVVPGKGDTETDLQVEILPAVRLEKSDSKLCIRRRVFFKWRGS